jgi:hypothetical protein
MIRTFTHPQGTVQRFAVADLCEKGTHSLLNEMADGLDGTRITYSDPPWNPGNEKWWRRHAKADPPKDFNIFLDGWCASVKNFGPAEIFVETTVIAAHRQIVEGAIKRNLGLEAMEEWEVIYGSPARPNVLIHYGTAPLKTDPSGMKGPPMTRCVFDGMPVDGPVVMSDPCMGKGMISREAHKQGWHCVGTELNSARLDKTIDWLLRKGYQEQ